jgi:hypothetical protein
MKRSASEFYDYEKPKAHQTESWQQKGSEQQLLAAS